MRTYCGNGGHNFADCPAKKPLATPDQVTTSSTSTGNAQGSLFQYPAPVPNTTIPTVPPINESIPFKPSSPPNTQTFALTSSCQQIGFTTLSDSGANRTGQGVMRWKIMQGEKTGWGYQAV